MNQTDSISNSKKVEAKQGGISGPSKSGTTTTTMETMTYNNRKVYIHHQTEIYFMVSFGKKRIGKFTILKPEYIQKMKQHAL